MATELTTNNIKIFSYMTGCMEHEGITPTEFMVLSELIGFIDPETCFFEEPSSNGRISYISSIHDLVTKLEDKFNYTRAKAYRYIKRLIDKDLVIVYDEFPYYQSVDDILDYSYCPYCGKRVKDLSRWM